MTTITSPRSQTPQVKSPPSSATPSTRSSLSVDRPQLPAIGSRRNRSALRDYYNLPAASPTTVVNPPTPPTPRTPVTVEHATSPIDRADFNSEEYVSTLLKEEGLAKIMQTEAELLSDIRSLDGEKKALVYDNYSKLIDATATIGRVRDMLEVEALTGEKKEDTDVVKQLVDGERKSDIDGKGKLDELVGKVVQTASKGRPAQKINEENEQRDDNPQHEKEKRRATIAWVLDTPRRLEGMIRDDEKTAAQDDWREVKSLLEGWKNIKGVEELKLRCEDILVDG